MTAQSRREWVERQARAREVVKEVVRSLSSCGECNLSESQLTHVSKLVSLAEQSIELPRLKI